MVVLSGSLSSPFGLGLITSHSPWFSKSLNDLPKSNNNSNKNNNNKNITRQDKNKKKLEIGEVSCKFVMVYMLGSKAL